MPQVTGVNAFRDNYIWVIDPAHQHHPETDSRPRAVILVDPGETGAIMRWLEAHRAYPVATLVTHHHHDHTGALADLKQHWSMPVYGPALEQIDGVTHPVHDGDVITVSELDLTFQVMATPGHTLGHVCYYGHDMIFTGDTLFGCGCGRLFEGTAQQMHDSLQRLARLPATTRVYCAHEYTLPNIGFAMAVEEGNLRLAARREAAKALRRAGQPTLPSSIGEELATNPFLRCHEASVVVAVSQQFNCAPDGAAAVFSLLRAWKDDY